MLHARQAAHPFTDTGAVGAGRQADDRGMGVRADAPDMEVADGGAFGFDLEPRTLAISAGSAVSSRMAAVSFIRPQAQRAMTTAPSRPTAGSSHHQPR